MRTCILYGRVSSRRQAETFPLPTQFRALREWAEANGYEVIAEVADEGGKDSKRNVFDRPGVERIFDLCESQQIEVVVAQDRSRFGEYPAPEMISYRLAESGTKLRTPSDSESEAGELMDLFSDWNSRRQRRTTAKRSKSRKLKQARNGYVVPGHTPPYGFRVSGERTRRVYEVEEPHMEVVRAIFRMVGLEGFGNRTVAKRLNTKGFPTPRARQGEAQGQAWSWRHQFVGRCVLNDCYRPHTRQELEALVARSHMAPEVAAKAPEGCGVWWYEGQDFEGNAHRVAVPVPASGVEREVADATPEQRRERYASLELRVVAHSKDELEVSGLFGTEMIYTCNPSPRPRRTTTPSSSCSPTASRSGVAGSPRMSSRSTSGRSPSCPRGA